MKRVLCALVASLSLASVTMATAAKPQKKASFEIKGGNFLYNGKPIQIHSGEMHYARIPHEYWRHRLKMLKAMGLNTVATYVFWNLHEVEPDKWDFSGDKDLATFIKTAGEEGLHVILRPGPYTCAEWEFGGYPWWLQTIKGLEIRRDNKFFLERTAKYIKRLAEEVGNLQITKGGPIVMVQVENEFGSYVSQRKDIPLEEHRRYNAAIRQQLIEAGFDAPTFTSDGSWLFEGGATPGALPTANGEGNIETLKKVVNQYHDGVGPYMVAEFYPGWLSHWAEPFPAVSAEQVAKQTRAYLQNGVSFNFYMAHGGTNFGFTSGANYDKKHDIQPDLTSYDYDAPISEAGWVTPKFDSIRKAISEYAKYKIPEAPKPIPVKALPEIKLERAYNLLDYAEASKAITSERPMTFEDLGQGYGYVLYTRHFNQPISGTLDLSGLRDYATVYIDGERVGELNRVFNKYTMDIDIPFNSTLQILVENFGRINYGSEIIHNTKGIIKPVLINGNEITGDWQNYKLPFATQPKTEKNALPIATAQEKLKGVATVYTASFNLDEPSDTFLDMSSWGKGIVFVNGHNLGRYWQVGPQKTLYLPGVWLKKGRNEVAILDQLNDRTQTTLRSVEKPQLKELSLPQK